MLDRKWKIYVIHHSHTDIGYTDLQEKIMYNHSDYIRTAMNVIREGEQQNTCVKDFKWNCESYYCVEHFFEEATEEEKQEFMNLVKQDSIGLSASYLNFTDLVDKKILNKRTAEMVKLFKENGIDAKVAMNADINGISLGGLDVLLDNGVEFLYTNIHCHHGMYPLYQNQKPYFWENKAGKKLLVFSGEHYNLGNALGLVYNKTPNYMTNLYGAAGEVTRKPVDILKENVYNYLKECADAGYNYNFIPTSVSGVFSDNAPPNTEIIKLIEEFNNVYGEEVEIEMVTIQGLYDRIKDEVKDAPTYKGDLTDWWAHGIGSTPYPVKHYKEAQRMYHLCERLDPEGKVMKEDVLRQAEENLLVYSEHTWGHSSTITNPYDTMVLNLDMRKNSYASKAHEASAKNLNRVLHSLGDKLRYYDRDGRIKAINVSDEAGKKVVEFYIEAWAYPMAEVVCEQTGKKMAVQKSAHPRGVLISFVDYFEGKEQKTYTFTEIAEPKDVLNTRVAYRGSEGIKDIVNEYDPVTYTLPYGIENDFFKISYEIGKGVTSFYNKMDGVEMLKEGDAKFFTPVYENTEIRTDNYSERSIMGRNIRGLHAKKYQAELKDIKIIDRGEVFTTVELIYELEGTFYSSVVIKMYHDMPRIDFKYKLAKTLSMDVENILLPLTLDLPNKTVYVDKSDVAMRPGIDQIPGTCMEYYLIDNGVVYETEKHHIAIQTLDAPLIYMGELKHHPIQLCDNKEEYNQRDVYSWIMNNIWETNFKMDLSGITEFCYTLNILEADTIEESYEKMKDEGYGVVTFMID